MFDLSEKMETGDPHLGGKELTMVYCVFQTVMCETDGCEEPYDLLESIWETRERAEKEVEHDDDRYVDAWEIKK